MFSNEHSTKRRLNVIREREKVTSSCSYKCTRPSYNYREKKTNSKICIIYDHDFFIYLFIFRENLFEGVNVTVARGKKWRYSRRGMLAIVFF
jgi:hypothetical protein